MIRQQITRGFSIVVVLLTAAVAVSGAPLMERNGVQGVELQKEQFLLRAPDFDALAAHGVSVVARQDSPSGDLWLVEVPRGNKSHNVIEQLVAAGAAKNAETVELAGLPALGLSGAETSELNEELSFTGTLNTPCLNAYMPGAWKGFTGQAATETLQLIEAQTYGGCGEGMVVAVIDTEIDTTHRHLADAVVPGYDFLASSPFGPGGGGFHADLDGRYMGILEASESMILNGQNHPLGLGRSVVILGESDDDAETGLQELPPYYGHGTMTAGLIRMVAPAAQIMPLVAFDNDGVGHPFNIIQAIYYAVQNGADIINMSFSMGNIMSIELGLALEYARDHGVIAVGATGNSGLHTYSFPASFVAAIGVASTDDTDHLTDFTNYGVPTGDLTAPGEQLVTLYPGGGYAVGWGTSFSTPLVTGTVALIRDMHHGHSENTYNRLRRDLLRGTIYRPFLWDWIWSGGRLNSFGAVLYSLGYL